MKTSPDCTKLISLLYDEDIIDIFDFEASAGTLSNFTTITGKTFDVGPYGLEFSSDSSKFYVSEGAGEKIYQYNLSYTAATEILNNEIEVGNEIELIKDDDIATFTVVGIFSNETTDAFSNNILVNVDTVNEQGLAANVSGTYVFDDITNYEEFSAMVSSELDDKYSIISTDASQ
jgi:hypothetical protein